VRSDGELLFHVAPGKLLGEILEALKIEVEGAGASNSIGSAVEEKGGGYRTDDRDAVFDISRSLNVAARQSSSIG